MQKWLTDEVVQGKLQANPAYTPNTANMNDRQTLHRFLISSAPLRSYPSFAQLQIDRQILAMAISTDKDGNTIITTTTNTNTTNQPQSQPDDNNNNNNNANDLKQQRQQRQQTKPREQTPKTETVRSMLLLALAIVDTYVLPSPTRTTIVETVHAHPILTTFLAAQFAVAFFPLLLFTLGVFTVGVVAAGLFACLGMVVLVPVLLVTGVLGVVVWGWGWGVFFVGRWAWGVYVEKRLGGEDGESGGSVDGERPVVVKSEPVDGNEEGDGASGKKWQFKAGFGDKWMAFG